MIRYQKWSNGLLLLVLGVGFTLMGTRLVVHLVPDVSRQLPDGQNPVLVSLSRPSKGPGCS